MCANGKKSQNRKKNEKNTCYYFNRDFSIKKIKSSDKPITGIIRILRISSVHFSSLNVYDQLTKKITAL